MIKPIKNSYLSTAKETYSSNFINLTNISNNRISFDENTRFLSEEIKKELNKTELLNYENALYICQYLNHWFIVSDLAIDSYIEGRVKTHELTLPDTIQGMSSNHHFYNTEAAPVLLLFEQEIDFNKMINEYQWTSMHENDDFLIYVYTEETAEKIAKIMSHNETLYIADGHHRIFTASISKSKDSIMAAFVHVNDIELKSISREIPNINDQDFENAINFLKDQNMLVENIEELDKGIISMSRNGKKHYVKLIDLASDTFWNNDVYRFNTQVLSQAFGIFDSGTIHYLEEIPQRLNDDSVLVEIKPMAVEEFICISKNNTVLPPKSTLFNPKFPSFKIFKKYK